jgi:hypothetical protein
MLSNPMFRLPGETAMNRSSWLRVVVVVVTLIIPAIAEIARAGEAGGPLLVRISGEATVKGRDTTGAQSTLGSGPFSLDLTVPSPFRTAPDNAGQQTWSSFSSEFWLNAPHAAFPRGGMSIQNSITAAREGEPDADFITLFIGDCSSTMCSLSVNSIGNATEVLGFEGAFVNVLLADGALGMEPFASLGEFIEAAAALDLGTASQMLFNATWVPECLLTGGGCSNSNGTGDIRFVSVDGTITDVRLVPEPATLALLAIGLSSLVARRRRDRRGSRLARRLTPKSSRDALVVTLKEGLR